MTEEELKKGWQDFSDKMPKLVTDGSMQSTFVFTRIDTMPDGGMMAHMLAYNLSTPTHVGMVAYQLNSLHKHIHQGNNANNKHYISRVLKLFNQLFQAKGNIVNKKDLN